ncbi:unnamed protein product [Didymodactylos carnosus]|uniref:U-box domain-containing protein n=1 Tax=Didymodactylos carnosus TaxID=1234261 RepID=A0A813X3U7_9BILA|nr:unnamed protein product [Didymodactylos carnosus]CAF3647061.1 unnamed protein product [Didymodactylos carnosus]
MSNQHLLETEPDLQEAYECAKTNNNWSKVSASIMIHPDWLNTIPHNRRWNILHQIVYSGDVMHLNEVLVLQATNPSFRLLCPTKDNKTALDIARERKEANPTMLQKIERLKKLDELLNYARECKWPLCKQLIEEEPNIVNEKPPYRRYYLAHHLAYVGQLQIFSEFSGICQFKLDLLGTSNLTDNKTVNEVARDNNHPDFAEYVERINPELVNKNHNKNEKKLNDDSQNPIHPSNPSNTHLASTASQSANNTASSTASAAPYPTHNQHNSQYDDYISISFYHPAHGMPSQTHSIPPYSSPSFTLERNEEGNLVLNTDNPLPYPSSHNSHHHHPPSSYGFSHVNYEYPPSSINSHSLTNSTASAASNATGTMEPKPDKKTTKVTEKKDLVQITDAEQAAYEKTIQQNLQQMSTQNLTNCITCCISKEILRDPVVAADGFTYEREEILEWFKVSNRSPMTNEELENLDVKPNHAIKQILSALTESANKPNKNGEDHNHDKGNKST